MADRAAAWAESDAAVRAMIVYGSLAQGTADDDSDLDVIIVAEPTPAPSSKKASQPECRLLAGILIDAIFALVIALEATGHIVFRGRLSPVMRGPAAVMIISSNLRHRDMGK